MTPALTRRGLLCGGMAAAGASALGSLPAARDAHALGTSVPSLKALGAEKGLVIGSCYGGLGDALDQALLQRHVALITPEWCLKPKFLKRDAAGLYRFAEADSIQAFCDASGIAMHGHTLFWHGDRFDWADGIPFEAAKMKYGAFLDAIVGRYPNLPSWDVVNEAIADPEPGLLRGDPLLAAHGLQFLEFLFRRTRALAPGAALCLNDYNLECGRDWCAAKQAKALDLIDQLLDRKVPLDAVGLQGHLSSRYGIDVPGTLALCDKLAQRGLAVYISELDVNDIVFSDNIAERDHEVADLYRLYLDGILAHPAVKRVVFWGLSDRDHWMVRESIDGARPAGLGRPGLFDHAGRPKAAYHAVAEALRAAPPR